MVYEDGDDDEENKDSDEDEETAVMKIGRTLAIFFQFVIFPLWSPKLPEGGGREVR